MRSNFDVICSGMRMTIADKLHVMVCYIYTKYYELNHDPSTEVQTLIHVQRLPSRSSWRCVLPAIPVDFPPRLDLPYLLYM